MSIATLLDKEQLVDPESTKVEDQTIISINSKSPFVDELRAKLKSLNLNFKGNRKVLEKRLKDSQKPKNQPQNQIQPFKYYLVFDVEATCEKDCTFEYPNEIIEFPVILVDSNKCKVIDQFHKYVKPTVNKQLSPFCTELTGITQQTVDEADPFDVVIEQFEEWLSQYDNAPLFGKCAFFTDGPWDIRDFVRKQVNITGIKTPPYLKRWIDCRTLVSCYYNQPRGNIENNLHFFGMQFEGRPHSGIDDSKNIARILIKLLEEGHIIQNTGLPKFRKK